MPRLPVTRPSCKAVTLWRPVLQSPIGHNDAAAVMGVNEHLSKQFDAELESIRSRVLEMGGLVESQMRRTLDAFARLDCNAAAEVIRADAGIDAEFGSILRQLITYMMEDPRTISTALDIVWVAKAIERIGDHAKNMAEYVIYIVKGTDVRHTRAAEVERQVSGGGA